MGITSGIVARECTAMRYSIWLTQGAPVIFSVDSVFKADFKTGSSTLLIIRVGVNIFALMNRPSTATL